MQCQPDYRDILDHLADGVYFVDTQRVISYWNRGAEALTGYAASEVIGRPCHDNILTHCTSDGVCLCRAGCPLAATIQDGATREALVYLRHRDGHRVPVMVRAAPLHDTSGQIVGAVESFSDATRLHEAERQAERSRKLSLLDPLTKMANRRALEGAIASRLAECAVVGGHVGLIIVDIDHFKQINDRLGHEVGDRVIRMVAMSMRSTTRRGDVVGRWGGDELAAVLEQVTQCDLEMLAGRMRIMVEHSFIDPGGADPKSLHATISLGLAISGPSPTSAAELFRHADESLYAAKRAGRNRIGCCAATAA